MGLTSGAILQAEDLGKQVASPEGDLVILEDINFSILKGETIAIIGVSGSGKSTLLGLMAGLDIATSGKILLDGVDLGALDEDGRARMRSQRVGFVFQSFQLLPGLTALENVMLPLELAGRRDPLPEARERLAEVGLDHRLHHYPGQLSGGEQQRVAIARAFAGNPRLLFADEPTGNLDHKTAQQIIDLLFRLNRERGATLVLVTHDPAIADHCARSLTLAGGRIATAS
ncbi:MAG: ABC transporter [Gammaproteobacteria bacterium RIFCSPLOWO2_02_FULL_56_15]|nr:MAG: ABC transporter [Gammaproteobacteria bacterium RIFCSPLOWO2_02_FULL_56_15]